MLPEKCYESCGILPPLHRRALYLHHHKRSEDPLGKLFLKRDLSFNYRLIYGPAGPLDYVVVHELCHLTHMNHSKDFWNMVERIMPDYRIYKQWLREHGQELTLTTHLKKQGIPIRLS